MARLQQYGLRRSLGVPGMFATAYGNVGSSIYYALGLVAAHALGLTPVVFIFAGGLFALTAKTYAEGASMFPEAGGSSSFARKAFNEVASFFAGWALSLDYIITIAISAFFVPHYLGAFFPALRHNPGDIIGGAVVVAGLAAINIRGIGESARLNIFLAVADLTTQVLLVALAAATILIIATNAGLIGISRLSWSLAEHRQLPGVFARLHSRFRTPYFTIVFFSVIAIALVIPGETDFLGNLYAFGAMLSFTTAHVSIIALRIREPDRERPYHAPWNVRLRGKLIPLSAVVGGIGTFAAWVSVVALHTEARTVGIPWMVLGMIGYVVYRRRHGLDLLSEHRRERPVRPEDFHEL